MAGTVVEVEEHDGFSWIWMNRPERRNALSLEHLLALRDAFGSLGRAGTVVRILGVATGTAALTMTAKLLADQGVDKSQVEKAKEGAKEGATSSVGTLLSGIGAGITGIFSPNGRSSALLHAPAATTTRPACTGPWSVSTW